MRRNVDRSIPAIAKLEIAIAAVRAKNFSMAEHFLPSILESKVPDIRAAGQTLVGIMEYMDGKVPEAVDSWLKARKDKDRYQAATYNLAIVALKFGAYKFADSMLRELDENWLVYTGRATVDRLSSNGKDANENCQRALRDRKNKLTLFNCALVEYQADGNFEKAKQMLAEASSMKGGGSGFDKKIFALTERVSKERSARPSGGASDEKAPKKN
jgi:tetratricopeptide (TPR) repeat protein